MYELMGHKMNTHNQFCKECGESKGKIVAQGLACVPKVEMEDDHDADMKLEMEREE